MNFLGEIRRRAHHIIGPVAGITLFGYFAYHVVQGDRGLIAWLKLSQQVETAQLQYDKTVSKRVEFSHRVSLLHPQSLDPDLLDERARGVLGIAHPSDVIVMEGAWSHASEVKTAPVLRPVPAVQSGTRQALGDLINTSLER